MPRRKRIQEPGYLRHVMSRGNGQMRILLDERDYRMFVYLLSKIVEELDIECWNYCVMPNHYHLALRHRRPNLSASIQMLNGEYAQWWNRRHRRVGHTFQGRFKDQIVQQEGYAPALCRYIARNPVRAGLVKRPEDWRWSSYAATVGLTPLPSFLSADPVLRLFSDEDHSQGQAAFSRFVLGQRVEDEGDDRLRSREAVVGDRLFTRALNDRFGGRAVCAVGAHRDAEDTETDVQSPAGVLKEAVVDPDAALT